MYISQEEAFIFGYKYLKLENNKYDFFMTSEDATNNNISPVDFLIMKIDVDKVNEEILKSKNEFN